MKKSFCALLGGLVILAVNAGSTIGMPAFKKGFEERYIGDEETSPLAVAFGEAKCYVCHVDGEKKEVINVYGEALAELLDHEDFKRGGRFKPNSDEATKAEIEAARAAGEAVIQAALQAVEPLESPTGDTYLERIEAGLLPVEFVPAPEEDE